MIRLQAYKFALTPDGEQQREMRRLAGSKLNFIRCSCEIRIDARFAFLYNPFWLSTSNESRSPGICIVLMDVPPNGI